MHIYALVAGILSDRLRGEVGIQKSWPLSLRPLHPKELRKLQEGLIARGYKLGRVDGVLGRRTRQAIRAFQMNHGLIPDAYASVSILSLLYP